MPTIGLIQGEVKYINSAIDLLMANVAGAGQVHKVSGVNVSKVVQNTLDAYPWEGKKQRASVSANVHEGFVVDCNEDLLRMILVNLIKNGLRGIARSRKGELHIASEQTASGGRLSVRDTGCGIPANQLPHIFKRFHSYPPTEGTGIGLAFCRETLARWGAKISCYSEEGVCTEFVIEFPQPASKDVESAIVDCVDIPGQQSLANS